MKQIGEEKYKNNTIRNIILHQNNSKSVRDTIKASYVAEVQEEYKLDKM